MKEIILNSVISEVRASYGNKRAPPRPYLVHPRLMQTDTEGRGRMGKDAERLGRRGKFEMVL